jgi:hypothetical protein
MKLTNTNFGLVGKGVGVSPMPAMVSSATVPDLFPVVTSTWVHSNSQHQVPQCLIYSQWLLVHGYIATVNSQDSFDPFSALLFIHKMHKSEPQLTGCSLKCFYSFTLGTVQQNHPHAAETIATLRFSGCQQKKIALKIFLEGCRSF